MLLLNVTKRIYPRIWQLMKCDCFSTIYFVVPLSGTHMARKILNHLLCDSSVHVVSLCCMYTDGTHLLDVALLQHESQGHSRMHVYHVAPNTKSMVCYYYCFY
jgi:hypothetical protein